MAKRHNGTTKGLVITISGPHGTGKSTYAKALAEALGLRYVCAGEMFRDIAKERGMSLEAFSKLAANDPSIDKMIDERTQTEAGKGSVIIDAQLGAWVAKDLAEVRVLLVAPDEVRFRRIAERDNKSIEEARSETVARELIQKQRYKKYYGIDVEDLSIYNLKIDTSKASVTETTSFIIASVKDMLAKKAKS